MLQFAHSVSDAIPLPGRNVFDVKQDELSKTAAELLNVQLCDSGEVNTLQLVSETMFEFKVQGAFIDGS